MTLTTIFILLFPPMGVAPTPASSGDVLDMMAKASQVGQTWPIITPDPLSPFIFVWDGSYTQSDAIRDRQLIDDIQNLGEVKITFDIDAGNAAKMTGSVAIPKNWLDTRVVEAADRMNQVLTNSMSHPAPTPPTAPIRTDLTLLERNAKLFEACGTRAGVIVTLPEACKTLDFDGDGDVDMDDFGFYQRHIMDAEGHLDFQPSNPLCMVRGQTGNDKSVSIQTCGVSVDKVEQLFGQARDLINPPPPPAAPDYLAVLKTLPELQKPHYGFGTYEKDLLTPSPEFLEVTRICRGIGYQVCYWKPETLAAVVKLSRELNVGIGLHYSPWGGEQLPDLHHEAITNTLNFFAEAVQQIKGSGANVVAVFFDDEAADGRGQEMIDARNNLYDIAKTAWPLASVEWYGYGQIGPSASEIGWTDDGELWTRVQADSFACSLYSVEQIELMREEFRKTAAAAKVSGKRQVTPWVALGCGYQPQPDVMWRWNMNWDYDTYYSYQLGAEINQAWFGVFPERFAPWGDSQWACFYPPVMDPRASHWMEHFIAYAKGSHLIQGPVLAPVVPSQATCVPATQGS